MKHHSLIRILAFVAGLLLSWPASKLSAQQPTMAGCFESMPDIFLPSSKNMRLDLLDFFRNGLKSTVKGPFDNLMEIEQLSDSYMRLTVSGAGQWQFKLLPTGQDTVFVLAVIQTVKRPVSGSVLSFYTPRWQKLSMPEAQPVFTAAEAWKEEVLDSLAADSYATSLLPSAEINPAQIASVPYFVYTLHSEDNRLEVRSSASEYLGAETYKKVAAAAATPLVFDWDRSEQAFHRR
ncbi:MAG: DUF3256 family protein [Bacteroidales bacterium]|nr:DUF3256 family protein [Bacteroidales bacterium]